MLQHVKYPLKILRLCVEQQIVNINKTSLHTLNCLVNKKTWCSLKLNQKSFTSNISEPKDKNDSRDKPLDIQAITGGDPELEHKLKILLLETEVLRQEGLRIPAAEFIKERHWRDLLQTKTKSARRKYLEFMFKVEKKKTNIMLKKELKKKEREENPRQTEPNGALIYDLSHNNMFLRIYDSTMDMYYNWRALQASMFGQKLIVDCGYYNDMTVRENNNCAKQLMYVFSENRKHNDPFDLHFCNMIPNNTLTECLHRFIPPMYEPWFPLNIHECSYLDLFPKEKLVYLTPHCRQVLKEYDHDAIYIIGGIVDKVNNEPLSLAKAKKEGLKMAKLPLDYYLQWSSGSGKSLAVNHMATIMLDIKSTGDWNYSLRHVPRRKVETEVFTSKTRRSFSGRLTYDNEDFENKTQINWKPKWSSINNNFEDHVSKKNNSNNRLSNIKKIFNE